MKMFCLDSLLLPPLLKLHVGFGGLLIFSVAVCLVKDSKRWVICYRGGLELSLNLVLNPKPPLALERHLVNMLLKGQVCLHLFGIFRSDRKFSVFGSRLNLIF